MSNVYSLEPPVKGKVTLRTTVGDLDIELWAKEAPKAVRNFVQLCMEGYYDNTVFHRIIKGFMAQGGDPTGTGTGGESIYGAPFKDEFHQRLRFTRRGLVACANANAPHTNGAQFFVTLDRCEWLDKRNTIFGRVAGDTIYNLIKLDGYETDADDRPLEPPRILGAEIVWNPFDDIVPRANPAAAAAAKAAAEAEAAAGKGKGKAGGGGRKRDLKLLSFGDDAEEDEAQLAAAGAKAKVKSAHDALAGAGGLAAPEETPEVAALEAARDAALARVRATLAAGGSGEGGSGGGGGKSRDAAERVAREREEQRQAKGGSGGSGGGDGGVPEKDDDDEQQRQERRRRRSGSEGASSGSDDDGGNAKRGGGGGGKDAVAERHAFVDEKRREMVSKGIGRVRAPDKVVDAELLKPWQVAREQYKNKRRAIGDRQADTLARLEAFKGKLRGGGGGGGDDDTKQQQQKERGGGGGGGSGDAKGKGGEGEGEGAYDGKVSAAVDHRAYLPAAWRVDDYGEGGDGDDDGEGGGGALDLASLRGHKLQFAKGAAAGEINLGGDGRALDDYVVFDPLLEKAKGKFSKTAQAEKKKASAWAGRGVG